MRVLFLLLAFAGALVFSTVTDAAPPGKGHLGAQTASTEIIAAVPANWPPQYSLDEDGNPTGFAIDVLNHLAEELNSDGSIQGCSKLRRSHPTARSRRSRSHPEQRHCVRAQVPTTSSPLPIETFRIVAVFIREGNVVPTLISASASEEGSAWSSATLDLFLMRERRDDIELEIYPTG
jgi:ABC-type amino acid transport substrate-binding protein